MKYKWIETSCGFFAVEDEKNNDEAAEKISQKRNSA